MLILRETGCGVYENSAYCLCNFFCKVKTVLYKSMNNNNKKKNSVLKWAPQQRAVVQIKIFTHLCRGKCQSHHLIQVSIRKKM